MEDTKSRYERLEEWEDGFMFIPEFRDELVRLYGQTTTEKPITINFTHYLVQQGRLPFYMGGNKLEVRVWRAQKVVRILKELRVVHKGRGRINSTSLHRMGGIPKFKGKAYTPKMETEQNG